MDKQNEKGMVNLYNQEMKELQAHQKQIEEMRDLLYGFWNSDIVIGDKYKVIAEALCNIGYRRIPENAVVLTKEEFSEKIENTWLNCQEFTRKETAEKFAERLKERFNPYYTEGLNETIDEICKEIIGEQ